MFKKPSWWDKPITWGTSVKMSLWSIPISLLVLLIEGLCFGWFDDAIDTAKNVVVAQYEKVSGAKDAFSEKWDNIFHEEET